jgi:hypothetical protein
MTPSHRAAPLLACAVAAVLIGTVQVTLASHSRPDPLGVSKLVLVESRDITRHLVEEVYRARMTNSGAAGGVDFARVKARLLFPFSLPVPGIFQVVDGSLEFGTVRSGHAAESLDTITVRRLRALPFFNLNHLRWGISARADRVVADGWIGRWHLTVTSRDAATNDVVAVKQVVEPIGAGEPLGFSLLPAFVRCGWSGTDDAIHAQCTTRARLDGCGLEGSAQFEIERNDSRLDGRGEWRVTASGACGDVAGTAHESMELKGVRLTGHAAPEPQSPGLLRALATHPAFPSLVATGKAALGGDGHD